MRSIALWIDVLNIIERDDSESAHCRRLTAVGAEDGWVELFLSEYDHPTTPEPVRSFKHQFDGPILSVRFFRGMHPGYLSQFFNFNPYFWPFLDQSSNPLERSLQERLNVATPHQESIHLLVANSYEAPVVYRNILQNGMSLCKQIPIANQMDILLATFVADINFDGQNEILLGKYSKVMQQIQFIW